MMSQPSSEPLVSEDIEQRVKQKLRDYFASNHRDRVEDQVNALLAFESHQGRLIYLQNKIGPAFFSSGYSILISGYSVGSEMIVAKQMGFGEVHGVEVRRFYYEVCQERLGHIPGMHPQIYEGSHLPYQDGQFAVVASSHVIEHTMFPELYLQESMRVLMPGGFLLLEFPHRYHPIELHTGLRSFEWMPRPVRNLTLKMLSGKFSPLDGKKKKGYQNILATNLQQISMARIEGALRKQQAPHIIVDKTEWRPGVIRCIIRKTAGILGADQ